MSVAFLMDENINGALTRGLRRRGIDVRTVQEEKKSGSPDSEILFHAAQINRLVVTNDQDFLTLTAQIIAGGGQHSGVAYFDLNYRSFKKILEDLEIIGRVCQLSEFADRVEYLPL